MEVYATQFVRDLLGEHGVPGETAYRFIQKCAFYSTEKRIPLSDVFLKIEDDEVSFDLRREIGKRSDFERCFDPLWWVRHENIYYERFGLNGKKPV